MATVALDASPANVLRSFRGRIVDAHLAYPEILQLEVEHPSGGLWRFATQDAEYAPSEPSALSGRAIEAVDLNQASGELRCSLSDGTALVVTPSPSASSDDPPNWELITPGGLALEFGPGLRWQIADASARPSR